MTQKFTVDDLEFELRRSGSRKTMEITIDRGGELLLSAPPGVETSVLEEFVREKRFWIYTKLAEKDALSHPVVSKEFVSGEGFMYLGRNYRLLLVDEQDRALKLEAGRFKLRRNQVGLARVHFIRWYTEHAQAWIEQRVKTWTPRVGAEPGKIDVRDLGYRWGSCGKQGSLNFHWATIMLPAHIVEYVIVHELVHLHEGHHTPEFWLRVERAMPDWESRKQWLAEHGGAVGL